MAHKKIIWSIKKNTLKVQGKNNTGDASLQMECGIARNSWPFQLQIAFYKTMKVNNSRRTFPDVQRLSFVYVCVFCPDDPDHQIT
ncbi:hypothetical protein FKM82_008701 [Ascaphus truei]